MVIRNYQEVIGGGLLIAIGIAVFAVAITSLNLSSAGHMGPGLFPAACGVMLAAIGLAIAIAGAVAKSDIEAEEEPVEINLGALVIVLLALVAFAALIRPAGMVPAVFGLVFIAKFAEPRITWLQTIVAGAILATFTSLIFVVGLKLPVSVISLPW